MGERREKGVARIEGEGRGGVHVEDAGRLVGLAFIHAGLRFEALLFVAE